ncbi:hypothetical protein Pmar_PMAR021013 [Perkinsus marinus ATCC 50983]|uniref:Uncharacterized protein n=1 Tax=Perkinsus marinus (strain ATCC 50983 / TXsc) TaxID=423536 RepID=C5KG61_PERM5|nr:hypothetical protein Pmar_PMAR026040 [Perkinsus marinus ATCC 50983]XP_002784621.1 hypothetical protein Pmar_PMAR021013 [Perkinsus marinus ATCC 50983]EER02881.1 hypothetical protein Pmar_PMAR026040 [Perkinsus marinus ATCC 50983]EER16417.1 hypothetical protein Pmar_PMAR021013 [Perkinsus marinus ATCC 50983]|eukprot:XP_002771065.1 hypothetical protein Pmar_PMAR026040 [Perkinsus marinus ATCC 50983]
MSSTFCFLFITLMRGFETKHPVVEWTNVRKDTKIPDGDELMEKFQDPSQADKTSGTIDICH